MKRHSFSRLAGVGLLLGTLLLLWGCGPAPSTTAPTTAPATIVPTVRPTAPAPTANPTRPPEAEALVYELDGDIWLYDGSDHRLLVEDGRSCQPLLSPDGRRLLFRREEAPTELLPRPLSLWVLELASGQEQALDVSALPAFPLNDDGADELPRQPDRVVWLPDSQTLLFNSMVDFSALGPGGVEPLDDLWLIELPGGQLRRLYAGEGHMARFALSPRGDWLLLNRPTRIEALSLATLEVNILLEFRAVGTYSEYAWLPEPRWLPDGQQAHVAIGPADPLESTAFTLWRLDVESSTAEPLGQVQGSAFSWSPNGLSWSPDGSQLLYIEDLERVVLSGADGSGRQEIASGSSFSVLGWSPQGRAAVYADRQRQLLYQLEAGVQIRSQSLGPLEGVGAEGLYWWQDQLFVTSAGELFRAGPDGAGLQRIEP
ncbi:MAG: hypothetical protein JXA37_11470 [Chloroflexia bacterium]|nr:hypothetical protein [Chloroflexia bacterium]